MSRRGGEVGLVVLDVPVSGNNHRRGEGGGRREEEEGGGGWRGKGKENE